MSMSITCTFFGMYMGPHKRRLYPVTTRKGTSCLLPVIRRNMGRYIVLIVDFRTGTNKCYSDPWGA